MDHLDVPEIKNSRSISERRNSKTRFLFTRTRVDLIDEFSDAEMSESRAASSAERRVRWAFLREKYRAAACCSAKILIAPSIGAIVREKARNVERTRERNAAAAGRRAFWKTRARK